MKNKYAPFFVLFLLFLMPIVKAQIFNEDFKSLPTPYLSNAGDEYGSSTSIDGDYAVVGAPKYKSGQGCAYLLYYNGTSWETLAKLTANDASDYNYFGVSVSISGDIIVIGASNDGEGSAYIFQKPTTGWTDMTENAKLKASDGEVGDAFGRSVSISNNIVVIGAHEKEDGSGAAYVFAKPDNGWTDMTQTAKLTASDSYHTNFFGVSVDISGEVIVVGSSFNYHEGARIGAAYVFERPTSGWEDINETAKLLASDPNNDNFGKSVSISGDVIVVGASLDDDVVTNSGSAYIFEKPTDGWANMTQTAKLTVSNSQTYNGLGFSVDIFNDVVVIGAFDYVVQNVRTGIAYIFEKPVSGWANMTETAILTASDAINGDYFGFSVSISGNMVVVGAIRGDEPDINSGSAYFFEKTTSTWVDANEDYKTSPTIPYLNNAGDNYGNSVAIDGNYAVIGSKGYKNGQGCAYVLYFTGSSWETTAILEASDGAVGDYFGNSVSISGDVIVVGAYGNSPGSAYVFEKTLDGWVNMTQNAKLTPLDVSSSDDFGYSVSISGNTIVIGAYNDDENGAWSGSAYVYEKPAQGWADMSQTAKLTASDGELEDNFGYSVSISGNTIVIGAKNDDGKGSAYVFEKPLDGWINMTQNAKLSASDGNPDDYFGKSVSIDGSVVVVGAYGYDVGSSDFGAVYVFEQATEGWANMTETVKLMASDGEQDARFGISVCISGDVIAVGTILDPGSAYIFKKSTSGWSNASQAAKTATSDANVQSNFDYPVCIFNDILIMGAPSNNTNGNAAGSAYLFQLCFLDDSEIPSITCPENQSRSLESGQSVYIVSGTEFDPLGTSDNCRVATILNDFNLNSTLDSASFQSGTTTVIWTVTDFATNQAQCSFDVIINVSTGINELANKGILIFPNPTSDVINLEFADKPVEKIEIVNLTGKIVLKKTNVKSKDSIDLSGLRNGIYIINIFTGTEVYSSKIIKE